MKMMRIVWIYDLKRSKLKFPGKQPDVCRFHRLVVLGETCLSGTFNLGLKQRGNDDVSIP